MEVTKLLELTTSKRNKRTSLKEVKNFENSKLEKYCGYPSVDGKMFTTWMGDKLGTITWKGQSYRSNMGDVRVSVDVLGINGCRYSGTMYGGDYIRLKRLKPKPHIMVTMQRLDVPNAPPQYLEYNTMKTAKAELSRYEKYTVETESYNTK